MREDPVLVAHSVAGPCFEIGGEFTPGSIRDQMVRAFLVVQRAERKGLISPDRPLLVIGAGPTGVTAALCAARLRIPTVVIDKLDTAVFTLSQCKSRDVEPTLYDWPAAHWDAHEFSWTGATMPLHWTSGRASKIAGEWDISQKNLQAKLRDRGLGVPKYLWSTTADFGPGNVAPQFDAAGMVTVTLNPKQKDGSAQPQQRSFGAVIACAGRGDENCAIGPFHGYAFWETDPFELPDCGCQTPPRVLVSGGGDGALQDFIRAATGISVRKLFEGLLIAAANHKAHLDKVFTAIGYAEDVACRAMSWNEPKTNDDRILERLHKAHRAGVAELKKCPAWDPIKAFIEGVLTARGNLDVRLLHSREFFTECYALNRFLVLLLIDVMSAAQHQIAGARLTAVRCLHQPPSTKPSECKGGNHEVTYTKDGNAYQEVFQVIVARHGPGNGSRIFSGEPAMVRRRQILPYFVEA